MTEAWLRGPVEGVPPLLMPAAHSLIDALEEIESAVSGLTEEQVWRRPGGAASVGYHLRHVPGSLDRLLTYARGEALSRAQLAELSKESEPLEPPLPLDALLARLRQSVESALDAYRKTSSESLPEPRGVGRAGLPSTVAGLLFHAAEHARRHAGQVIVTARVVRGAEAASADAHGSGAERGVQLFDLDAEVIRAAEPQALARRGRVAHPLLKGGPLRVTVIALAPGGELTEHRAAGPIMVRPLQGRIQFLVEGTTYDLGERQMLAVPAGVPHSVASAEGASFLLTVGAG